MHQIKVESYVLCMAANFCKDFFFQLLDYVCTFLSSNLRGKNPHKDQMGHELTCLLWRSSAVADRSEVN